MNILSLFYGYLASVLGLGAYHAADDSRYDDFGGNATDREYIAYLHDMVNRGEMTEEEALSKLKSNWKGNGDPTEYYNSYTKNANGTSSVGGYGFGFPDLGGLINSLTAYYTRNELTGAEREQNAFNAQEAQTSRDFTEYMARNKYTMETQSMQAAGVNPAMVYGGGNLVPTAANGAAAQGSPLGGGNIADLLSTLVRMPLEMKKTEAEIGLLKSQENKTDKEGNKIDAETGNINADTQVKIKQLDEIQSKIENNEADTLLKLANVDKTKAEEAVDWARYAQIGLSNELQEKLNPLLVEAQELQNDLNRVESAYREKQILARLAEVRAHTAALYAQAALAGAQKEGQLSQNKITAADARFATNNAQNRANLLRWTAYSSREGLKQAKYQTQNAQYYSEHYEEAFRHEWEQSGVEFGYTQMVGQAIGNAAMLGMMLCL